MGSPDFKNGLHIKDLRVNDGIKLYFDYCPIGEGDGCR
jgi:hypothetical protein